MIPMRQRGRTSWLFQNKERVLTVETKPNWTPGSTPIAVLMIAFNEAHNIDAVLDNLEGWAQQVFLVDSFSSDKTVEIALSRGVHVIQRTFTGFGDQWNYAVSQLPVEAPWSMKLDPDERLTPVLKQSITKALSTDESDGFEMVRRLWFMGKPLAARHKLLRIWRTGRCRFSDVTVNEHPLVEGKISLLEGDLEHHDSPNLHHWYDKQNRYTTMEALAAFQGDDLSVKPNLFGSSLARRMWLKHIYMRVPFRHFAMTLYCFVGQGAWKAGRVGFIWSRLRGEVYRMIEIKTAEMKLTGKGYAPPKVHRGDPHPDVENADNLS